MNKRKAIFGKCMICHAPGMMTSAKGRLGQSLSMTPMVSITPVVSRYLWPWEVMAS